MKTQSNVYCDRSTGFRRVNADQIVCRNYRHAPGVLGFWLFTIQANYDIQRIDRRFGVCLPDVLAVGVPLKGMCIHVPTVRYSWVWNLPVITRLYLIIIQLNDCLVIFNMYTTDIVLVSLAKINVTNSYNWTKKKKKCVLNLNIYFSN